MPCCEMVVLRLRDEPLRPLAPNVSPEAERAKSPHQEMFAARANTVPTYLECNRHMAQISSIYGTDNDQEIQESLNLLLNVSPYN